MKTNKETLSLSIILLLATAISLTSAVTAITPFFPNIDCQTLSTWVLNGETENTTYPYGYTVTLTAT